MTKNNKGNLFVFEVGPNVKFVSAIKDAIFNKNNTITDGGSTAPLYCGYHTEEKTIQEQKRLKRCKRDSRASIVGCLTSVFAPSARTLLHCFLLKLGNN